MTIATNSPEAPTVEQFSERITRLEVVLDSLVIKVDRILECLQNNTAKDGCPCNGHSETASTISGHSPDSNALSTTSDSPSPFDHEKTLALFRHTYESTITAYDQASLEDDDAADAIRDEFTNFANFEPSLEAIAKGVEMASVDRMQQGIEVMQDLLNVATAIVNGKESGLSLEEIRYNIDVLQRPKNSFRGSSSPSPSGSRSLTPSDSEAGQSRPRPHPKGSSHKGKGKMSTDDVIRLEMAKQDEATRIVDIENFDEKLRNDTQYRARVQADYRAMLSAVETQPVANLRRYLAEFKLLRQVAVQYADAPSTRRRLEHNGAWERLAEDRRKLSDLDNELRRLTQSGQALNKEVNLHLSRLLSLLFSILEQVCSFQIAYRILRVMTGGRISAIDMTVLHNHVLYWLQFTYPVEGYSPVPNNTRKRSHSKVEDDSSVSANPDSEKQRFSPRLRAALSVDHDKNDEVQSTVQEGASDS